MTVTGRYLVDTLGHVVSGALIHQRMVHDGCSEEDFDSSNPEVFTYAEWLWDNGFHPYEISLQAMRVLVEFYRDPRHAALFTQGLSTLLWQILGDPKSGDPPPIYAQAAYACYRSLVETIDPDSNLDREPPQ
ncbi:MAG: hypothetical protein ACO3P8_12360 [Steroidobacteraceae bacterium]